MFRHQGAPAKAGRGGDALGIFGKDPVVQSLQKTEVCRFERLGQNGTADVSTARLVEGVRAGSDHT